MQGGKRLAPDIVQATTNLKPGVYINVTDYGAVGDGITDDTKAIHAAAGVARVIDGILYFPPGRQFFHSSNLNLFGVKQVYCAGILVGASATTEIIIGYNSTQIDPTSYFINKIRTSLLRIQGLKNADVTVWYAPYILLWADGDIPTKSSIAYSNFRLEIGRAHV